MSRIIKAKSSNPTIVKGSIRNLLDGSNRSSLPHMVNKIITIHSHMLDEGEDSEYTLDDTVSLLDSNVALVLYSKAYHIFNTPRDTDCDFLIVGYCESHEKLVARGYNISRKEACFAVALNDGAYHSETLAQLLDNIWRELSTAWRRPTDESIECTGILAFERDTGNMVIPFSYIQDGIVKLADISEAEFTLIKVDSEEKQAVESNTQNVNAQNTKQENTTMSSKINSFVAANKSAAASAAKLEAGKVALTQLTKVAAKALPSGMAGMFAKQYLDTPIGRVVVANLLNLAVEQYAPQNVKAKVVAKAAMDAAMLEVVQSFNISEMIEKAIDGVNIEALTANVSEE